MITKTDLEKEISTTELLQLSDINADGVINDLVIDDAINDAIAYISSFIKIPANPTPYLRSIAVDLTLYELRKIHQLQDEDVRKKCEEKLIRMAKGTIPLTTIQEQESRKTSNAYRHGREHMSFKGFN